MEAWYRTSLPVTYAHLPLAGVDQHPREVVKMLGKAFSLVLVVCLTTSLVVVPSIRAAQQDDIDEYLDVEEGETAKDAADDGKVVTLTAANFDTVIKGNKNVLVRDSVASTELVTAGSATTTSLRRAAGSGTFRTASAFSDIMYLCSSLYGPADHAHTHTRS
jgi:hypothetical protein